MARTLYIKEKKLRFSFSRQVNPILSRLAKKLKITVVPQIIVFSGHESALKDADIFSKFMNNANHPTEVYRLTVNGEEQAIVVANTNKLMQIRFVKEDHFIACHIGV